MVIFESYTPTYNAGKVPWHNDYKGQSFTIGITGPNEVFTLTSITILTRKMKGFPGIHTVKVYAADENGYATGSELSTGTFDPENIPVSPDPPAEIDIAMSPVILQPNTKYVYYIIGADNVDSSNYIGVYSRDPGEYAGGTGVAYKIGVGWSTYTDDFYFKINGTPVAPPPPPPPEDIMKYVLIGAGVLVAIIGAYIIYKKRS